MSTILEQSTANTCFRMPGIDINAYGVLVIVSDADGDDKI